MDGLFVDQPAIQQLAHERQGPEAPDAALDALIDVPVDYSDNDRILNEEIKARSRAI